MPPEPASEALVRDRTIYSCVMGSRAFGLATDGSDTDRRGIFLAPAPLYWRFDKPPTHTEGPAPEQFSWELERFLELALRANPNVLECLHSPLVEHIDDTGRELLDLRGRSSPVRPTRPSRAMRSASARSWRRTSGSTARRAGSTPCTCCVSSAPVAICCVRACW